MYCKKCRFHSFDHVAACPKCGANWDETRKALYLNWITGSGVNWLAPAAAKAAQAPAQAAAQTVPPIQDDTDAGEDFSHLIAPPPAAPSAADAEIDVSLFPELDFSAEPAPLAKPAPSKAKPAAARADEDLFLDSMPVEDMPELDFSASFDTPAEPAPPISKPKREDLFIPELEEMLAPLTEEPRQNPAPAKKAPVSGEPDILLDFGNDSPKGTASDDAPFLSLDDTIKPS